MFIVLGFYKFKNLKSLKKNKLILQKLFIDNNIRGTLIISKEGLNGIAEVSKRIQELITKAVGDKETRAKEGISYEHAVRKTLEEYKKNN